MRHIFILSALLGFGCFQAIDFPGEQAEIVSDDVNNLNSDTVNEAIFDELVDQTVDVNQDGIDDFGFSIFLTIGADQDAAALCEAAQDANSIEDLANAFDDVFIAGSFILKVEAVNDANGFDDGEKIAANFIPDVGGFFIFSFFAATQEGNLEALAESFGDVGNFEFDDFNGDELSANFDDKLEFENSNGNVDFRAADLAQEINLDADIDGVLFKAAACANLNAISEEFLLRRFNIVL
jgi:hypothetical protein